MLLNYINKSLNNAKFTGLIFVLPAFIGTIIFIVLPILFSFVLSFYKWDLINDPVSVGVKNYVDIFTEPVFYKIITNTFVYAISTSIFAVIIPLILACIINTKIKFSEFFKTSYFLPFITPVIVIAIVWQWIFDPNIGFLNHILQIHINWLYDERFAMPALIIVSVWKLIGYNMLIFLAGLSSINQSLIDSAKIDGAGYYSTVKNIILPLLAPTIFFVIVITSISSFQVFDLVYMMTQGGPLDSTNVLVYSIYKNAFEYFQIGKASSIAYILFAIISVLTLFQCKLRKKLHVDF